MRSHLNHIALCENFHKLYYDSLVWKQTTYLGIHVNKAVQDLWNYQEILAELRPSTVVEIGVFNGGSILFFADVLGKLVKPCKIIGVDITKRFLDPKLPDLKLVNTEILIVDSLDPIVPLTIHRAQFANPGPTFVLLDGDHEMNHVLAEMEMLRPLLKPGDYLIVEDSNLNGHPVREDWGPGPWEAIEAYFKAYPNDYEFDKERAFKYGWTQAPNGFLRRKQ